MKHIQKNLVNESTKFSNKAYELNFILYDLIMSLNSLMYTKQAINFKKKIHAHIFFLSKSRKVL